MSTEIANTKKKYNENLRKFQINDMCDLSKRSQENCEMIDKVLKKYKTKYQSIVASNYKFNLTFNKEVITKIEDMIENLGTISKDSKNRYAKHARNQTIFLETTIIDKHTVLESDKEHKYDILKIIRNGVITVDAWDIKKNKGKK